VYLLIREEISPFLFMYDRKQHLLDNYAHLLFDKRLHNRILFYQEILQVLKNPILKTMLRRSQHACRQRDSRFKWRYQWFSRDCSQELEIKAPLSSPTAFKTFGPKLPGLTRKSSSFRNYILDTTVTSITYFHRPLLAKTL